MPRVLPFSTPFDDAIGDAANSAGDTIPSEGFVPDDVQRSFWLRNTPIGYLDPAGDATGRAETVAEGIFSPGEEYDLTGYPELIGDTISQSDKGFIDTDPDRVDLAGPALWGHEGSVFDAVSSVRGEETGAAERTTQALILGVALLAVLWVIGPILGPVLGATLGGDDDD